MIRGEKIGLRAIQPEDLIQLMEWRNIPYLRKHFREVRELNKVNQKAWLEKISNSKNDFMFVITDLETQEAIGACGLMYCNWTVRSGEISLYIGRDGSYIDNNGYALDASKVLLNYGFQILNLHKIWTELYAFDDRKMNLLVDQLGFSKDGVMRDNVFWNGEYYDSILVSLLAKEYVH